ncbi:branched-chain amino acid ABC transporter permease [Oceanicella actignis]|uniref:Branched-chain amino acid transport system permease protein n=1 Tax=Oceanicella actignis TaxID=1189325 RepID=A0A1M7S2Z5_9RHOB|nr:branched-chain amino acid ABC transporter permease [Oceanicella actignis]TYO90196.1 branched-chain amino acid transport system permease protein [Oceanicella actignis]SES89776.1 amino acid/amide ABC transporter membrane protein 1, HAAT family [Oceanicella actignis]SHN52840.1 branched-chain amino acid transport system permease protein [Oceanicella actignis]
MDFSQLLVGGIANGCVYGLVALGFVLIYKATEAVNFAQGDMMMLGAFIALQAVNEDRWGLPFALGLALAVVLMGAISWAIEVAIIRRLFGQPQFAVVILTIALGFVLRFVAGVIWGHEPQTLQTPMAGRQFELGPVSVGYDEAFVILATAALTLLLYLFFARTKLGIAMQAASQNQLAAYYVGVPVKRVSSMIWALSGMLATVAGVLFAAKGSIDPSAGLLGIKAFAAAVIGGFGSLPGALLGGLLIGLVETFAARYGAAGYSQIAPYAIMLLVLVLRPNGLFAQFAQKKV